MATATSPKVKKRVRISCKPKASRNPLFEKWLLEMKEEAERKDLKTKFAYGRALKSLQKYPLRLHSGKECKVLQHFGSVLCDQLDKRLEKYLAEGGVLPGSDDSEDEPSPPKKVSKNSATQSNLSVRDREYIPTRRSGAYALIFALHKHSGSAGFLTKIALQEAAQPYADVSFTQTSVAHGQYYSAWSAMSTLIKKELVEKTGNPAKYKLTESGQALAIRLERAESELHASPIVDTRNEFNGRLDGPRSAPSPPRETKKAVSKLDTVAPAKKNSKPAPPDTFKKHDTGPLRILQPDEVIQLDDDDFDRYPLTSSKFAVTSSFAKSDPPGTKETCNEPDDMILIEEDRFVQIPRYTSPLKQAVLTTPSEPASLSSDEEPEPEAPAYSHESITLRAGQYDVVLCVDNAEIAGSKHKEAASKAFQNCGVPVDFRKLAVGDYLWICKPRPESGLNPDQELILPYVVERKRLDDLVQSIKDGRFKEQKFRLVNSGLPRPIYLVEEFGNRQNLGLPEASMMQAIANTLMIEKFQVHWAKSSNESVAYLVEMTRQCAQIYKGKTVTSRSYLEKAGKEWQTRLVTFKEYYVNSTKQKPVSVTQMLAKHLMQLAGLSAEKSEAIVKRYPTPTSLMEALQAAGPSASLLLANIEYGKSGKAKRKIGPALSGIVAMLYTEKRFAN